MKYTVVMPLAGAISVEVEADSKKAAIEAFWEAVDVMTAPEINDSIECEYLENITTGNVCHAPFHSVHVIEEKE